MQLDKDKLAAYRVMLLDVVDAHDLLQLVELLDDLLEDDLVALHDDRHARNARIIGRGNGQRVDVVAAAAEKAGNARQNTGVILYGDRKDKLFALVYFPLSQSTTRSSIVPPAGIIGRTRSSLSIWQSMSTGPSLCCALRSASRNSAMLDTR